MSLIDRTLVDSQGCPRLDTLRPLLLEQRHFIDPSLICCQSGAVRMPLASTLAARFRTSISRLEARRVVGSITTVEWWCYWQCTTCKPGASRLQLIFSALRHGVCTVR